MVLIGFWWSAFEFWVKTRDREWEELQEADEGKQHGSSTRTVQVRRVRYFFRTRVSCTGRVRCLASHGSSTRAVQERRVRWFSEWHGACWSTRTVLIVWLARVSLVQHGACSRFLVQHGACRLARVRLNFCTGRAIFFFWGRKPNLSQFSGLFWFENLNWIKLGIGLIQNFIMKLSLKF